MNESKMTENTQISQSNSNTISIQAGPEDSKGEYILVPRPKKELWSGKNVKLLETKGKKS